MTTPASRMPESGAIGCLSREELQRWIGLKMAGEPGQRVGAHVEACQHCRDQIHALLESEWIDPHRTPTVSAQLASTCERIVDSLCRELAGDRSPLAQAPIPLAPAPTRDWIGSLNQRYLIRREIGSGSTATVFEAHDNQRNRPVAIKFIRRSGPAVARRILREIRALERVSHPNLVPIESVETTADGRVFLVMPLVSGHSLSEMIHQQKLGSPGQIVEILSQVAAGLSAVHEHGLLHRDVKPSNILVDREGIARLTDFGLALFVEDDSHLTETGAVVGTPAYMSPEQASEGESLDPRSDLWSLGATLYECLTETRPFRGQPHQILRQIREQDPIRPGLINPAIPRPLEAICLKTLRRDRAARYASVAEFRADLQRWQQGQPVLARLPGLGAKILKWLRRDPRLTIALSAAIIAVVAGSWVALAARSRSAQQMRLAESRFDASLQTIHTLADLTSESLLGEPGMAGIRQQVQRMADRAFEPLIDQRPDQPAALARYLDAMNDLGNIRHTVAGPAEALAFRRRMVDENRTALRSHPDDEGLRQQWAWLNYRLAASCIETRDFPAATAALDEAASVLDEENPADLLLSGSVAHSRGTILDWVAADSAGAAREYRRALDLLDAHCLLQPDDRLALRTRNNTRGWLAFAELKLGESGRALDRLREVWTSNSALAEQPGSSYLDQLDKYRAAAGLLSALVSTGNVAEGLQFGQQIAADLDRFQAANPSLMEPAAIRISIGCDTAGAELREGKFDAAVERCRLLLAAGEALDRQFPDTTRSWSTLGYARQMWFLSCLNAGDLETAIPFAEQWISQIDTEIGLGQNAGFNQQLRQMLLTHLAVALEWNDQPGRSGEIWQRLAEGISAPFLPAVNLASQTRACREALREGQPLPPVPLEGLGESLPLLIEGNSVAGVFPATNHLFAEWHALAACLLEPANRLDETMGASGSADDEAGQQEREQHLQQALQHLTAADACGYFRSAERRNRILTDPLFAEDRFQALLADP